MTLEYQCLPVHLGVPDPEPEPVDGCEQCAGWARERAGARAAGDMTRVADCNVHIRRHPHNTVRTTAAGSRRRR